MYSFDYLTIVHVYILIYSIWILLHFAFLTQHDSFATYPCSQVREFYLLYGIPLYNKIYLFTSLLMSF